MLLALRDEVIAFVNTARYEPYDERTVEDIFTRYHS